MKRDEISLGFVGDFCLSHFQKKTALEINREFVKVASLSASCNLAIANLEFSITESKQPLGAMNLTSDKCADIANAGFDVFCLANNHIKDYGEGTMLFTEEFLKQRGLKTVGIGKDRRAANSPLYITDQGRKIGIINFTDATHYRSTNLRAGVAALNSRELTKQVKKAKKNADLVVVIMHSDLEFTNYPAPWRVKLSRLLIDVGADLIVHHHPHTLQGVEYYKHGFIAYSLGNFLFPIHLSEYMQNRMGNVNEAGYLKINIEFLKNGNKKLIHEFIPTFIDSSGNFHLAFGEKRKKILNELNKYSCELQNMKKLEKFYFKRCKYELKSFLMGLYYELRKHGSIRALDYCRHHLSTAQHTNWMIGFLSFGKR